MRYHVSFIVRTPHWVEVDAGSPEEALEKAKAGDFVEGTQDSDPGRADMRTYRVND